MIFLMVFLVSIPCLSDEAVKEDKLEIKTWKLPVYMAENLQNMIEKFNMEFQIKVNSYKAELIKRFAEFEDMPEDAILDLRNGIFITTQDFLKLQAEAEKEIEEQIKEDKK